MSEISAKPRKTHKPAAVRNIGFTAYKYYAIGAVAAGLWVLVMGAYFFPATLDRLDISEYRANSNKMVIENYEERTSTMERMENRLRAWRVRAGLDEEYTLPPDKQRELDESLHEIWGEPFGSPSVEATRAHLDSLPARNFASYEKRRKMPTLADTPRFIWLIGSFIALTVWLLAGSKWSPIPPLWITSKFGIIAALMFAGYFASFWIWRGWWSTTLWAGLFLCLPPLAFLTVKTGKLAIIEYAKEHPFYRRIFIHGRGGEAGRWGGLREYFARDMTGFFRRNWIKIKRSDTSDIYLGRTLLEDDIRIGGRDVGIVGGEQHLMTVAATGGGKSRDAIFNTLLSYSGGVVAFDMKGEIFRVTAPRRQDYAPLHLLDPYGEVADVKKSDHWNPMDEIDPNGKAAREKLQSLAEASIYAENVPSEIAEHFQENSQLILRGFMAHVKTKYPREQQHLGTVYDLLKKGDPDAKHWSKEAVEKLLIEMAANQAIGGAPSSAAQLLNSVGPREKGSFLSTIARGIDWINAESVREIITKPSSFSVADAKSKEASIFLVLPEMYLKAQSRFIRTFYSMAFDMCDNHITDQPAGSDRRVLFLFDEFNALGHFKPAENAVLTKRGSFLKCWFIVQNLSQFYTNYKNANNFIGACDKQFFGLDVMDDKAPKMIVEALGQYTQRQSGGRMYREHNYSVMPRSELAEWLDIKGWGQIVIPVGGKPLKLNRVPYYKNYDSGAYGTHKH
jgi:type IV secretory pathway TraG/TraD family ATPase VirD4